MQFDLLSAIMFIATICNNKIWKFADCWQATKLMLLNMFHFPA